MKIKAILRSVNCKADKFGNRYWYLQYIDTETGKRVYGTVSGGEGNISDIPRQLGLKWDEVYYYIEEQGVREFDHNTKGMEYAGCTAKELIDFIKKKLLE